MLMRYWTSWLGRLHRTENMARKFGALTDYNRVLVRTDGGFETWLLTDAELARIRARAAANVEERVCPTRLDDIILRWTR